MENTLSQVSFSNLQVYAQSMPIHPDSAHYSPSPFNEFAASQHFLRYSYFPFHAKIEKVKTGGERGSACFQQFQNKWAFLFFSTMVISYMQKRVSIFLKYSNFMNIYGDVNLYNETSGVKWDILYQDINLNEIYTKYFNKHI